MGRDTIQLEDAVSTIYQEYLLEFSSEYFIPKNLHPELPGPGDHIVDFPEGKIGVFPNVVAWPTAATKDDKPHANTYSVVDVATLDRHRTPFEKQPVELLCLVGLSRNFFLHDDEYPMFLNDNDQEIGGTEATVEPNLEKEVISMGPTIRKRRRQRDAGEEGSKAPAKVLRKDHDAARAEHSAHGGKSLAEMSVDTELAIHAQETKEPPVATQIVNDPHPLSYAKPLSQQDVTQ
ncbi:hypothetical protein Tco_0649705 [Tanacetum coccineum]